ncbi:MAG: hypothetical protein KGS72_29165, partial [Cyanobacteria bacterium REEB67]|nr:hypothetical protein [Cyanobacteria bacterium REEB67]
MVDSMARISNSVKPAQSLAIARKRAWHLALGVACSIPLSAQACLAHSPAPLSQPVSAAWTPHSFNPSGNASGAHHLGTNNLQHFSASPSSPQKAALTSGNVLQSGQNLPHAMKFFMQRGAAVHHAAQNSGSGADLNLSSAQLKFLAGNLGNFSSLTIDVGGRQETVFLNTKLTAAELVAVQQMVTTGAQEIKLSANGTAAGGTVQLNNTLLNALDSAAGGAVSSLTISRGVEVVDNLSALTMSGRLANYGTILTASSAGGNTDVISAASIVNGRSGVIGSYTGGSGLFAADPVLTATTSLLNTGAISSSGNITINAPVVSNLSAHSSSPTISAANNVSINTKTLNNDGLISALGNINVSSANGLTMNGAGGTMQAKNGNFNFNSNNADIDISGGNLLSQNVNFVAGSGNINAYLDNVTGVINSVGNGAHILTSSDVMTLGTNQLSGDPTFADISGDINLQGQQNFNESAAFLAAGNIKINTSSDVSLSSNSKGYNIIMLAGGTVTTNGDPTGVNPIAAGKTATIDFKTGAGGIIDLTTNNTHSGTVIDTSNNSGAGGNVILEALANGAVGGTINVPSIATGGSGSSSNGSVTMIAGSATQNAIQTTLVNMSGGSAPSGAANFLNAQPTGKATFDSFGNFVSNTLKTGALVNGGISIGSVTTGGANLTASSLGPITFSGSITTDAKGVGSNAGNVLINGNGITLSGPISAIGANGANAVVAGGAGGAGGRGGNITITTGTGDLTMSSSVTTTGGAGGQGLTGAAGKAGGNGGVGGVGGNINITATSTATVIAGIINVSALGTTGGQGGAPGDGGASSAAALNGGAGGAAGSGGAGGAITITSTGKMPNDIHLTDTVVSSGGN